MLGESTISDKLVDKKQIVDAQPQQLGKSLKKSKRQKKGKGTTKQKQDPFTRVLKYLNVIIALAIVGFSVYFYIFFNRSGSQIDLLAIILPGYIGFSGLIILMVEIKVPAICRNMKFLTSFIGRGLFNIYVGIMPLGLINGNNNDQIFQIIVIIMAGLMCLVGALYIIAKIFCCAKQEVKATKAKKKQTNSDGESISDSSNSEDKN